jgi:hypothetical protein
MPNTKHVPRMNTNNLDSLNPCFNDTTIAKIERFIKGKDLTILAVNLICIHAIVFTALSLLLVYLLKQ